MTAEQNFLVGDQPGQPHGVDVDAVDLGATSAIQRLRGGVGRGLASARLGDELGRTPGRATRRIDLVGVMQLDDLDGLEVWCGDCSEPHHEHGGDTEVGCDEYAAAR